MSAARPRRALLVALGVLVPFLALVLVAALWRPLEPEVEPAPGPSGEPGGPAPDAPADTLPPDPRPAPRADAPRAGAHFSLEVDGGLAPEVARLVPEVLRCAEDQASRAPARLLLEVTTTLPDGGPLARVSVRSSWQDPYLAACVEDVFEELGFTPGPGGAFAPSAVRFSLVR